MLDNNSNIDELLREGMANFEPTPPADAWDFIQSQVQPVAPSNPGLGEKLVSSIKQMGIVSKVALVLAVPVLAGISYFVLNQTPTSKNYDSQILVQTEPQKGIATEEQHEEVASKKLVERSVTKPEKEKQVKVNTKEVRNLVPVVVPEIDAPVKAEQKVEKENNPNAVGGNNAKEDTKKLDKKAEADNIPIIRPTQLENNKDAEIRHEEPILPNAFSPNSDGRNDLFEIQIETTNYYHIRIYDKKGQLIFDNDQANVFWNGLNFKSGMECEAGVYTYIFDYQFEKTGKIETKRGFINLLR